MPSRPAVSYDIASLLYQRKCVKRSQTALFPLIFLLLLLTGCNKKEKQENPFSYTQEINDRNITEDQMKDVTKDQNRTDSQTNFLLSDTNGRQLTLSIDENHHLLIDTNISHSISIVNLFSPWSYPSKNQLPYLVDLQKKYPKDLQVIGIVLNPHDHAIDQINSLLRGTGGDLLFIATGKENNRFAKKVTKPLHLPDFIPVPLTIIYHNGIYFRHYEGAVPIEMIDHDIQTIMQ